jgi:4-hydroxy-tetrahydrodipicolinate synthase
VTLTASALARQLTHGLVPAVPVPHGVDGAFEAAAQEAFAAWMATQDVAGVAAWAHTGRGLHLPEETAAAVLSSWRRALPPGKLLIAGAGARPRTPPGHPRARVTPPADPLGLTTFVIEGTLAMARAARDLGADAILVFPPALLADLEDCDGRIVDLHAALADVGLPLLAFSLYAAAGGCTYGPRLLERLLALPHVAGVKVATLDSVVTFQAVAALVPAGKVLLSGEDRFLGYSLMMGAEGALVGLAAARTALAAGLLAAWARGDHGAFVRASASCDRLGAAAFTDPVDGYVRRMLWLLALEGVIPKEAAHDPWGPPVPEAQLEALARVARDLPMA